MSLSNLGIDAFLAIVKSGSVHQAADLIGLSQTGVTQRIRSLERRLAVSLFVRSRKGMLLTKDGYVFLHYCEQHKDLERQVVLNLGEIGKEVPLDIVISGPTYLIDSYVIKNSSKIIKEFASITFNFDIDHSTNLISKLRNRNADFIISMKNIIPPDLATKPLNSTSYILVGPKSFKGRTLKEILRSEKEVVFSKEDQFCNLFLEKFKLNKLNRNYSRVYINNEFMVPTIVSSGMGYMILDQRYAEKYIMKGLLINLLPEKEYVIDWQFAWLPRREMPSYFQYVIDNIQ